MDENDINNVKIFLARVVELDSSFRQTGKTRFFIDSIHRSAGKVVGIVTDVREKQKHLGYSILSLGQLDQVRGLRFSGVTISYDPSAVANIAQTALTALKSLAAIIDSKDKEIEKLKLEVNHLNEEADYLSDQIDELRAIHDTGALWRS